MVRTYDKTLREAQAQQTRQAILDAAVALIGTEGDAPLSFGRVAEKAGVSEPTVYRNFPNREALIAAISAHVSERFRGPAFPTEADALPAAAVATAQYFSEHPEMLRAALRSGSSQEVREHGRRRRVEQMRKLLDEPTSHLERKDADAIRALFQTLIRAETWLEVTDRHDIDSERAGFAMAWAVRALLDALRRDQRRGVTTIIDEKTRVKAAQLRERTKGRNE
jgi:AcrR family transcriptional regulator